MKLTQAFQVLAFILLLSGCRKEGKLCRENEPFDPVSSVYISVETNQGKKYCMSYSELIKVTPFDIMSYQVGREERIAIYCGVTKLNIHAIERILASMNNVVYEVKSVPDSIMIKDILRQALDSSGVFNLHNYDFDLRGNMIEAAINEGYIVYFNDYQGHYFWEKE